MFWLRNKKNVFRVHTLNYYLFLVYCCELAPSTISLTGDWAQGDDSKHDLHYKGLFSINKLKITCCSNCFCTYAAMLHNIFCAEDCFSCRNNVSGKKSLLLSSVVGRMNRMTSSYNGRRNFRKKTHSTALFTIILHFLSQKCLSKMSAAYIQIVLGQALPPIYLHKVDFHSF